MEKEAETVKSLAVESARVSEVSQVAIEIRPFGNDDSRIALFGSQDCDEVHSFVIVSPEEVIFQANISADTYDWFQGRTGKQLNELDQNTLIIANPNEPNNFQVLNPDIDAFNQKRELSISWST